MRYRLPVDACVSLGAFACAVWVVCLVGPLPAGGTQEKQPEKADQKPDEKVVQTELLDDAKNYTIRVTKPGAVLKWHEKSVHNFANAVSGETSSVFVWLDSDGRPAVAGRFFRMRLNGKSVKKHALHSLSQIELEAKFGDKLAWTPDKPGVEWKSFPDAPAVAATQKERLAQMKQLAKPFKVTRIDPKEKASDLRLAPEPVYAYAAPKAGVTDGAVFAYLSGVAPQAILLVEAFDEKGKTGFRYAFARFHFWRTTAKLGDETVWDVAYDPIISGTGNKIGNPEAMKHVYNSFYP